MNTIITALVGLVFLVSGWFGGQQVKSPTLAGHSDPFLSIQLATSPSNGNCLTTDGTNNTWSASCGGVGSGEANTASNLGTGLNLFDTKSGVDLRFNSIKAGTNITLSTSTNSNTIVINSTATGGGSGNVATSTTETKGQLAYWTSTGATPATLGQTATNTASCSSGVSCTAFSVIAPGAISITNSSPDQTVSLANGTGINVTGTYPSFTITNTVSDTVGSWFTPNTSWGATAQATTSELAFPQELVSSSTIGRLTAGSLTSTSTSANQFVYTNNSNIMVSVASSSLSLPNTALQNSSIVVTTASPLGGAATVSLGGTLALTCTGCLNSNAGNWAGTWQLYNPSNLWPFTTNTISGINYFSSTTPLFLSNEIISSSTIGQLTVGALVSTSTTSFKAGSIATAALAANTISGITLGSNLSAHTVSGTLTGTSYNGSAAVSDWAVNLGNANKWTAAQTFSYTATSTWGAGLEAPIIGTQRLFATSTSATSSIAYGLIVSLGGIQNGAIKSCSGSSALNADASGNLTCGAVSGASAASSTLLADSNIFSTTGTTTFNRGVVVNATGGSFGVASSTFSSTTKVMIDAQAGLTDGLWVYGNVNNYFESLVRNANSGTTASADMVVANDLYSKWPTYYGNFGINSSGNTDSRYTLFSANDVYLYSNTSSLNLGTASSSSNSVLKFFTGGTLAVNERMRITSTGLGAFGTTTPFSNDLLTLSGASQQLTFTDTTATSNQWNFRNAAGTFYLASSSSATGATTSPAAITISNTGYASLSVGTSTAVGALNLGTWQSTAGSTTIKMGKLQFEGANSAGIEYCIFINSTGAWATTTGKCNP